MPRGGSAAHRWYSVVVFVVLASLDNVAIALVPPLYESISVDLAVSKALIGAVTAAGYLVSAVAAVVWAYVGDRTDRKPLLMAGTLLWAAGTAGTGLAAGYPTFLLAQLIAAVGLGAVGSVGFSVVTDLVAPRRRGLVLSFWGLSQGVGTLTGTLAGGLLGATDWRRPFLVLTVAGLVATVAYLFTYDIKRGQSEPEVAAVLAAGGDYDYRISRADLRRILDRRTNVWLILQGISAQAAFGSMVWLPVLFSERALSQGYSLPTATMVGSIFATLFQLGAAFSIAGGLLGDVLQRRNPRGRALVAAVGILAAVPFYLVLFFVPMRIEVPDGAGVGATVTAPAEWTDVYVPWSAFGIDGKGVMAVMFVGGPQAGAANSTLNFGDVSLALNGTWTAGAGFPATREELVNYYMTVPADSLVATAEVPGSPSPGSCSPRFHSLPWTIAESPSGVTALITVCTRLVTTDLP